MLCLAFHNPANLRQLLDDNDFVVSTAFTDEEWTNLKTSKSDKTKVLFCNSIIKLRAYNKVNKEVIKKFKVVCFDTPHNLMSNNYVMLDAKNRTDGIWTFKAINSFNFVPMLLATENGLKAKKLKEKTNE